MPLLIPFPGLCLITLLSILCFKLLYPIHMMFPSLSLLNIALQIIKVKSVVVDVFPIHFVALM